MPSVLDATTHRTPSLRDNNLQTTADKLSAEVVYHKERHSYHRRMLRAKWDELDRLKEKAALMGFKIVIKAKG
jgi:hypothetical protein